ncbi:MAG: rubrerythrin family protein [Candidatus Aureabacteria bacterium]|nr:rubrerythrin family protein [Candidatus Auribacterota bacterium]
MIIRKRACAQVFCATFFSLALLFPSLNACAKEQAASAGKTTLDNLIAAHDGESNANARYLAFAKKADEEGYGPVASLFRAAARAEQVHFERHAAVIKKLGGTPKAKIEAPAVKTTKENLEVAMKGEIYESEVMYPEFLAQAKKAGNAEAVDTFEDAKAAEAVHAAWYKKALSDLNTWKGQKKDFSVCPTCGNVVDVLPGPACPICMTDTKKFIPVS